MSSKQYNPFRAFSKNPIVYSLAAVLLPLSLATLAGCGSQGSMNGTAASDAMPSTMAAATPSSMAAKTSASSIPQSKHVVMVMEENRSYSSVVGDTGTWPNLNRLIREGALPTHYYANTHPSIGNYFMLTTGQILTNNDSSRKVWNVPNIARQMLEHHVSFKIYAENIEQGYVGGNTGPYLVRHEPFELLSDIADNRAVAKAHIWPFTQFAKDVKDGTLPEFSYIVPDVNHDAHNGSSHAADAWLETKVVLPLSSRSIFNRGGDGVLIVDFDEAADSDSTHGGGHVSPVLWGPIVKADYKQQSSTVYQHQSMLRTVMAALRLSNPPGAAANAHLMSEFFK